MRTNLNEQAERELIAIANILGYRSLGYTLNKLVTDAYQQLVNAKLINCEEINKGNVFTTKQQ
jgi:hypothetical protein